MTSVAIKPEEKKRTAKELKEAIDYYKSAEGKHGAEYSAIRKASEKNLPALQKQYEEAVYAESPDSKIDKASSTLKEKAGESEKTFADLQKQAKTLAKEQTSFRDEQIKEAEKLSKWHSNLATDYQSYLGKMKDEVKTVEKEYDAKRERLQQGHYANVGMMSQASLAGMRGKATTGSQQAVAMATAQRSAGDDYANAMNRMDSMQAQKEQIAMQMSSQAMGLQMSAIQTGASIQSQQIGMKANAQNNYSNNQLQSLSTISGLEQTRFEASTLPELMDIQGAYQDKEMQNQLQIAAIQGQSAQAQAAAQSSGNNLMKAGVVGGLTSLATTNPYAIAGAAVLAGGDDIPVVGDITKAFKKFTGLKSIF